MIGSIKVLICGALEDVMQWCALARMNGSALTLCLWLGCSSAYQQRAGAPATIIHPEQYAK